MSSSMYRVEPRDLLQRLARSEAEDIAGNYFKPRRANELLSRARAQRDAARALSRWRGTDKPHDTPIASFRVAPYSTKFLDKNCF